MPNTSPANTSPTLGTRANTVSPSPVDTLREKLENLKTDFELTDERVKQQLTRIYPATNKCADNCYKIAGAVREGLKACQNSPYNKEEIFKYKKAAELGLSSTIDGVNHLLKVSRPELPQLYSQLHDIRTLISKTNRPTNAIEVKAWDEQVEIYLQLRKQVEPIENLVDTLEIAKQKVASLQAAVHQLFPQSAAAPAQAVAIPDDLETLKEMLTQLEQNFKKACEQDQNIKARITKISPFVQTFEKIHTDVLQLISDALQACNQYPLNEAIIREKQNSIEAALQKILQSKNSISNISPSKLLQFKDQMDAIQAFINTKTQSVKTSHKEAWNLLISAFTQLRSDYLPREVILEKIEMTQRQVGNLRGIINGLFPQNGAAPAYTAASRVIVQSEPPTGVVPPHPTARALPQSSPSAATTKSTTTTRVASTLATASAPVQTRNPIAAPVAAPRIQVQLSSPVQRPATTSAPARLANTNSIEEALVTYYTEAADAVERHNEQVRRETAEMKKRVDIDTATQIVKPLHNMIVKLHHDFEAAKKTLTVNQYFTKNSSIANSLETPFNKILEALQEGFIACDEPQPNSVRILALQHVIATEMSHLMKLKTRFLTDPYPIYLHSLINQLKDIERHVLTHTRPSTTLDAENWDLGVSTFNMIRGQVLFKETVEENIQEITTNMNNFNARVAQLFPRSVACHATQFNPTHPIQIPRVDARTHTVNSPVR